MSDERLCGISLIYQRANLVDEINERRHDCGLPFGHAGPHACSDCASHWTNSVFYASA